MIRAEENFNSSDKQLNVILEKFKQLLKGESVSIDEFEFDDLINYFFDNNQKEEALNAINRGLAKFPYSLDLKVDQFRYFLMIKNSKEALNCFEVIKQIAPLEMETTLCQGEWMVYNGQKKESEKFFYELLLSQHGQDLIDLVCDIANIYIDHEDYTTASLFLRKIKSEAAVKDDEYCSLLALCYEDANNYTEAARLYNLLLDHDPYASDVWSNLGRVYFLSQNFAKAAEAYEFSYIINPSDSQSLLNQANSLYYAQSIQKALELYQKYLSLFGDSEGVYIYIGDCYTDLQLFDEALQSYLKALQLKPFLADALIGICSSYISLSEPENALPYCAQLLQLPTQIPDYKLLHAQVLLALSRFSEAAVVAEEIYPVFKERSDINILLAHCYIASAQFEKALPFLLSQSNLSKSVPGIQLLLAIAYYHLGRADEAVKSLSAVLESDSSAVEQFFAQCPQAMVDPLFNKFLSNNN